MDNNDSHFHYLRLEIMENNDNKDSKFFIQRSN